ncbi:hypothetical protein Tco_0762909 [Tanacetum coccineum]
MKQLKKWVSILWQIEKLKLVIHGKKALEKKDNIEKGTGKEKIDAGKTEERKAEHVMRKQKFEALMKKMVRKGRLAELVKNSKKESEKGNASLNFDLNQLVKGIVRLVSNNVAVKKKMAEKTVKGKMKNLHDETEHIRDKPEEALDGESTDDDFVASEKIKMNKAVAIQKKPSSATATNGKCIADPENSNVKEKAAKDKVERVNRVHSWIPPINLFLLVMDVLGVPLGDVHLDARDETDYRNPLTRAWKAQFPASGKRHFTTKLAETILSNGQGGWMFKINFLLIPPIKWCTSDVLATLEKDKFPNDDGDDPAVNQESEDEGLDEEHVREDDEFGEYGPDRVPTDMEMAEFVDGVLDEGLSLHPDDAGFVELKELRDQMFTASTFSQKPCKYQEPADQTYDNCHTSWNGRTQHEDVIADGDELLFIQLCIELSDRVCAEFHRTNEPQDVLEFKTPDQPKRLNFNDGKDLDLNITQPPATQGKEVGDGQNTEPQDVLEFKTPNQPKWESPKDRNTSRGLSRFGQEYLLNENKSMIPICLEPKSLNVVQPLIPQRRAKWPLLDATSIMYDTSKNCGVFAMRHMETYRGEGDYGDLCCLKKEGPEQLRQINELRYKYTAKILLADCNKAKSKFEQETYAFKTVPVEEKKRLRAEACEKIKQRAV